MQLDHCERLAFSPSFILSYLVIATAFDYSWHEMGVYDLPAFIDYILTKTEQRNLYYIGHSMGTTMFYVMASTRPEYNSKIKLMISLSPVAYMAHIKSSMFRMLYGPLGVSV